MPCDFFNTEARALADYDLQSDGPLADVGPTGIVVRVIFAYHYLKKCLYAHD